MVQSLGIEEKVAEFRLRNTKDPKYLFLDKKSHEIFSQSFRSMERYGENIKHAKITAMYLCGVRLNILSVDTEENLIEIA